MGVFDVGSGNDRFWPFLGHFWSFWLFLVVFGCPFLVCTLCAHNVHKFYGFIARGVVFMCILVHMADLGFCHMATFGHFGYFCILGVLVGLK